MQLLHAMNRTAGDYIRFHLPPEIDPDRTILEGIIYEVVNGYYLVTVMDEGKIIGGAAVVEQNIIKES